LIARVRNLHPGRRFRTHANPHPAARAETTSELPILHARRIAGDPRAYRPVVKRLHVLLLAVVALLAFAAPATAATGCDFGVQTTSAFTPTGESTPAAPVPGAPASTLCEGLTHTKGTEPILARNGKGTLFAGMATDIGLRADDTALLRSRDDGRTWKRIPLPVALAASEGMPYVDPDTDRLFVSSLNKDYGACGQPVAFSDDEGDHWTEATGRPGCDPYTAGDWPKLFTGPFKGRKAPGAYPNAVYFCNFIPNILVAASSGCWRSDDGGATFAFQSLLPTINGLCRAGDQQETPGATIVHGTGQVLAGGDVVVPVTVCGNPVVVRSTDEGKTWTAHRTGGRALGLTEVLGGQEGVILAVNDHVWSENLAQDEAGNLYFAYLGKDGARLDISRDGGKTWRRLGIVTPPGLRRQIAVAVTARGVGELAITYYATSDEGDPLVSSTGMNWRPWATYTPDALAARPVFHSAPTSPPDKPAVYASSYNCCTGTNTFLEYTGVRFLGSRTIGAIFTRWTTEPTWEEFGTGVPELTFTRLDLPARSCASRRRFVIRLPRALVRDVIVTRDGRRVPTKRAGGRVTAVIDLRGAQRRMAVVRVSGRDATGRRVTQTRRYRPCTARRR